MIETTYVEHVSIEVEGFRVADATSSGNRPHDDLIWVGYGGMNGRWMTPEQASSMAQAISPVVASHIARHDHT